MPILGNRDCLSSYCIYNNLSFSVYWPCYAVHRATELTSLLSPNVIILASSTPYIECRVGRVEDLTI